MAWTQAARDAAALTRKVHSRKAQYIKVGSVKAAIRSAKNPQLKGAAMSSPTKKKKYGEIMLIPRRASKK